MCSYQSSGVNRTAEWRVGTEPRDRVLETILWERTATDKLTDASERVNDIDFQRFAAYFPK